MGQSLGCRPVSSAHRRPGVPSTQPQGKPKRALTGERRSLVPGRPGSLGAPTAPLSNSVLPRPQVLINHTVEVLTGLKVQLGLRPQRQRASTRSRRHCITASALQTLQRLFFIFVKDLLHDNKFKMINLNYACINLL